MAEVSFRNISILSEEQEIFTNINFDINGIYSLKVRTSGDLKNLTVLFSKAGIYTNSGLSMSGEVYVNKRLVPASKFHMLLNPFVIFDSFETVEGALNFVDRSAAEQVLADFNIGFASNTLDSLSIDESRVFELMLNLVAMPTFIYLKSLELPKAIKVKCIEMLRKYLKDSETVCLIESDAEECFDGCVIIKDDTIVSLNKSKMLENEQNKILHMLNSQLCENPPVYQEPNAEIKVEHSGIFNYSKFYEKFKCQKLVDLKRAKMPVFKRLAFLDIYKVSLLQAVFLSLRRYNLMIERYQNKKNLCRGVGPFVVLVVLVRIYQELCFKDLNATLVNVLYFLPIFENNLKSAAYPLAAYLTYKFYIRELDLSRIFSIVYCFFRRGYTDNEHKLLTAFLCLCIFYQDSNIFDDDVYIIRYYINVAITPGTYFVSNCFYICLTQVFTFATVTCLFNIKYTCIHLLNATFINMAYALLASKRSKEAIIGFFLCLYINFPNISANAPLHRKIFYYIVKAVFPSTTCNCRDSYLGFLCSPSFIFYNALYFLTIFVVCCSRISTK